MRRVHVLCVLVSAVALSACSYQPDPKEEAAKQEIGKAIIEAAEKDCTDLGYVKDTAQWYDCALTRTLAYTSLINAMANQPGKGVQSPPPTGSSVYSNGQPVYTPDECIGPIIMGVCHGQILPKAGYRPKCYGQMLNGVCTGPMF